MDETYPIQGVASQEVLLPDIAAEILPQLFGRIIAVGGRVARVPVRLRCGFTSVAPSAFEEIAALGAAVTAEVAVHPVPGIDILAVLMRLMRLAVIESIEIGRDNGEKLRQELFTYECSNSKDTREKIQIVRADSMVDVEVHNKVEVRWVIVFSLI